MRGDAADHGAGEEVNFAGVLDERLRYVGALRLFCNLDDLLRLIGFAFGSQFFPYPSNYNVQPLCSTPEVSGLPGY